MMALLYAVQGAFWPLLALHLGDLGFTGRERGWIFASYPIATIITSLGAGAIVDRLMPSQRYLSICYGVGTAFLISMALGWPAGAIPLFVFFLIYWLVTAPTYGISNAIAFRNLRDPNAEFGRVRKWGTIGWMLVGWFVSLTLLAVGSIRSGQGAYPAFWVSAILSGSLGIYALILPNTPPLAAKTKSPMLGTALALIKTPGVGVYLITAFILHLTTPFVFQAMPPYLESLGLPRAWAATALTLGQWPEILALAGLPFLLRRLGFKATLGLGILAWLVRFTSLVLKPPLWLALAGIPLHGIGIACFTVGGQVFLDSRAPDDRRASAQALNMTVTAGLGSLLGSLLSGDLQTRFGGNYAAIFLVPCLIHAGLILFFVIGFRPDASSAGRLAAAVPALITRPTTRDEARPVSAGVGPFAMESANG
jgi:MFS family permease